MTCSLCGLNGIHACPGEPLPAWDRAKVREFQRILRQYERPSSRNQMEGRYVGAYKGKHVRRRALMPALTVGDTEVFPAYVPFVDCGAAWLTMNERSPVPPKLPLRLRGRLDGMLVEVKVEGAAP